MNFKRLLDTAGPSVTIAIEGETVTVPAGETVASALLAHGIGYCRTTPVSGARRAPLCLMGVCFECLVEIDGTPNQQACMIRVREGMRVRRQHGAGRPEP